MTGTVQSLCGALPLMPQYSPLSDLQHGHIAPSQSRHITCISEGFAEMPYIGSSF